MRIISLAALADAMQNNRFVLDDCNYPDYVDYQDEGEMRLVISANEEAVWVNITEDAIMDEDTNIVSITDTAGVKYEVKFLSSEPINPF